MQRISTQLCLKAALLVIVLAVTGATASAGLIGTTVRYQCPQCGPPFDQTFLVTAGGPELTPFGQYAIDVQDTTIRIEWTISSQLINPGHHVFSELSPFVVSSAVLDPSSTWIPAGINFTADSVLVDFSGQTVRSGTFALINLNGGDAQVPEPSTFVLVAAGLLGAARLRRRNS